MVFIQRNKDKQNQSFNVLATLGLRTEMTGIVGLEIEVEGKRLPQETTTPRPWLHHHDGSLRGSENAEYVLAKPIPFKAVGPAVQKLWEVFTENKSTLDESNRTSVHVHLNVQRFHVNRLTALTALYFTFEELLTEWCGEHRVGNLFCLRAKDAPAIISQLRRFIRADMRAPIRDTLHYAGLNPHALVKFGSLEFRTLRGTNDPDVILQWVAILERLYELSAEYPDPREICYNFSGEGPISFFERMLGEHAPVILKKIGWTEEQVCNSLYEGIRMAQDLCYCRNWDEFRAMELKPDPFGRSLKKVAQKVANFADTDQAAAAPISQNPFDDEPMYIDEED